MFLLPFFDDSRPRQAAGSSIEGSLGRFCLAQNTLLTFAADLRGEFDL
jgi:hypothetical protein